MKTDMLKAVNYFGGTVLIAGIIIFCLGFFANGSSVLTPIGIGTIMGAIFVFLMGLFLIVSEEMLLKAQGQNKD